MFLNYSYTGNNNGPNATFTLSSDQLNHIQKYGNIVLFVPGQRSILNYEYNPGHVFFLKYSF